MKLRTSFFDRSVLKKDITRFTPVWGLYTIFMLLVILLLWDSSTNAAQFAWSAPEIYISMGVINFIYAALCAGLLFSDLFNPRMCNALHAMPLRREGWFLTHAAAGMLFCIVPNLLGTLVASLLLQQYSYLAFLWFAIMVLQYLFFFGVGVFACLSSGNFLGAAAMYGIINFLAVLVSWLAITFVEPVLYGITLDVQKYFSYSPVVAFCTYNYLDLNFNSDKMTAELVQYYPEQWRFLGISAAVGVLFLGCALLLYRKRKLESAGDLIAFRGIRPVFLVVYSLCAGAVAYLIADITTGDLQYLFLFIGLAVGFFTGLMLLEKTLRIFRKKTFAAFGAFVLGLLALLVVVRLDPIGVTRYIPKAEQVAAVQINPYGSNPYYRRQGARPLTDPEDIAAIIGVHEDMVQAGHDTGSMELYIDYTMKNGATVSRVYRLDPQSEAGQVLKNYYSSVYWIFGSEFVDPILKEASLLEVYGYYEKLPQFIVTKTYYSEDEIADKWGDSKTVTIQATTTFDKILQVQGLINAIVKDCEAGTMAQVWDFHNSNEAAANVIIEFGENNYGRTLDFTIYADAKNTVSYLEWLAQQAA